jgi:hypothetical protein
LAVEEGLGVVFDNDVVSELVLDSVWHEKVWVYSKGKGGMSLESRDHEATERTTRA